MTTIVKFDDLSSMLDLKKPTIDDYPNLAILSDSVHDALESYVGRTLYTIEKKTESGYLLDDDFIGLKNIPITSVTSVKVNGTLVTDYTIGNYGITLANSASGSFEVVTKGGFKTIPGGIYRAELMQIIYEYQNINNLAVKSFGNDGGSTQTNEGFALLKEVKRLLEKYKHTDVYGF